MRAWKKLAAATLLTALTVSSTARAARITTQVTVDAYVWNRQPAVKSYANATLYQDDGVTRIYQRLIMGHRVVNFFTGWVRFNARVVSDFGYTNSDTGVMQVDGYGECYYGEVQAWYNAGGVSEYDATEPKCVPDPIVLHPYEPPPQENCPIVIDVGRNGYDLSGPDPAVHFDIDADGEPEAIAWTHLGGDEAFLALDRNDNGVIDDGTELFGYVTPLRDGSRAINGYRALAELDIPALGGNGDGKLDGRDARFANLLLWNDFNRDGVSQAGEIRTAASAEIVELGFDGRRTRIVDRYGNLFWYRSWVLQSGQQRPWFTYDVVFAAAP